MRATIQAEQYRFYYENEKVKAYKKLGSNPIVVELIKKTFGTPEEILNAFDFTITKFAYYKERKVEYAIDGDLDYIGTEYKVLCDNRFFEHLHQKRLVVDNQLLFPISSLERSYRYAKYGYFPCKETKVRLVEGIRQTETLEGISNSLYDGLD